MNQICTPWKQHRTESSAISAVMSLARGVPAECTFRDFIRIHNSAYSKFLSRERFKFRDVVWYFYLRFACGSYGWNIDHGFTHNFKFRIFMDSCQPVFILVLINLNLRSLNKTFMNFPGEDTKSLLETFMCAGLTSSSFAISGKIPAELE